MTNLLQRLQSIDLEDILSARNDIQQAVGGESISAILEAGAAQTALGELGGSLDEIQQTLSSPETLLEGVLQGVTSLGSQFDAGDLPLTDYANAVREGAGIVAQLFEGLEDDPLALGKVLGLSMGDLLQDFRDQASQLQIVDLSSLREFQRVLDLVENGIDSSRVVGLALEMLMPVPRERLETIRNEVDFLLSSVARIELPSDRISGLIASMDAVTLAAGEDDLTSLQQALSDLQDAQAATIEQVRRALLDVITSVGSLRVAETVGVIAEAGSFIRSRERSVLDFMEALRREVAEARQHVEDLDPSQLQLLIAAFADRLENEARDAILSPIDEQVARLELWLRELLAHLHLRELRAQVSQFFEAAAQEVRNADLDAPAEAVRVRLDQLEQLVANFDLTSGVTDALQIAQQTIDEVLQSIRNALTAINTAVGEVASQARAVLADAVAALEQFRALMDEATQAVNAISIRSVAQEIVERLRELRATAEELLSEAPLPDSMRPLIDQLISTLENLDLDAPFQEIQDEIARVFNLDDIAGVVRDALAKMQAVLENLITDELIASIEAEVHDALETVRQFDPDVLLDSVRDFINQAADAVRGLDPRGFVQDNRGPYDAVLGALDTVEPHRLLAPVIDAYDELLGNIPLPDPQQAVRDAMSSLGDTGDQATSAVTDPISDIAAPFTEEGATAPTVSLGDSQVRPGDAIRLLGYLPMKLREALAELEADAFGDVLESVDSFTRGLARDLRQLQEKIGALDSQINDSFEALIQPLRESQVRARVAVSARLEVGSFEAEAALDIISASGPGALRLALADTLDITRAYASRAAFDIAGQANGGLERMAIALENASLVRLLDSGDDLLAALDPEPIAAEVDELIAVALRKLPETFDGIGDAIERVVRRMEGLIVSISPGNLLLRFLPLLDLLAEELDVLNPRRLADDLVPLHTALREALLAYDPMVFAEELNDILVAVADQLASLTTQVDTLSGSLDFIDTTLEEVENLVPTNFLSGIDGSVDEVGRQIAALDPSDLLDAFENIGPRLIGEFAELVDAVRDEIVALLQSIRYVTSEVSASASSSVEV